VKRKKVGREEEGGGQAWFTSAGTYGGYCVLKCELERKGDERNKRAREERVKLKLRKQDNSQVLGSEPDFLLL